jgi:hypothetical protein
MSVLPIQIHETGILIPRIYLPNLEELEVVALEEYILLRAKPRAAAETKQNGQRVKSRRFSFVGSSYTRNPFASTTAEEILHAEMGPETHALF